jgi:hypothetical protein
VFETHQLKKKNNKEYTCGAREFLVGICQNFILPGSLINSSSRNYFDNI